MQTSKINRLGNGVVCVLLVVCLVFSSFFNVRKAEAIAPAIPAAGAALAALAAELGISETALIAGIAVTGVAATGLVAYGNAGTDTTLPPAPGFKPWDDLTPQEKQDWVGQDGNALDYQKQTIAWWALQYGLLEQTPNGGIEPTPEPEPDNDPNGNKRWNKIRNALIILSVGGASIPLNETVNAIADGLTDGFKSLLFGDSADSLQLSYISEYEINGATVPFMYVSGMSYDRTAVYNISDSQWNKASIRPGQYIQIGAQVESYQQLNVIYTPEITFTKNGSQWQYSSVNPSHVQHGLQYSFINNTVSFVSGGPSLQGSLYTSSSGTSYVLNPCYAGKYVFANDATFDDGVMTGHDSVDYEYGQLSDTPDGLSGSIINNNNYNNFINNYSDPGVDGYQRAITVPAGYGASGYQPNYSDFVVVTPDSDVTPLPDDEQIPSPGPDGPDNPDTPNTEYQQDFGQRVGELLAQPFGQLFPFCLIGDLREFLEILQDAGFGSNDQNGMRALSDEPINGIDVIRLDLRGFNVEGADYFEIELTPIHDFAVGFRGIATSVFIIMLLLGTFRFFINRGGE